ncbi:unnamed protein product [[Actinomadura] parvosata subsp. kistnae]|uniref:hypothetical protein n=1 Tax=[Actinomadura] parvosata TaxID=1955412 RepID=UPI000D293430|nr:hypothetical protein [Nonomuraea sp. ATCC 55076]SPL96662.1 unnamed protein product [Actinomadura parvosata subsp. kistnae]
MPLLVSIAVAASVWAGMQTERPAREVVNDTGEQAPLGLAFLPSLWRTDYPPRSADSSFDIVFADDGDRVLQTHVLRLEVTDPLVSVIRQGRFTDGEDFLFATGLPVAYIGYGAGGSDFSTLSRVDPPVLRSTALSREVDVLLSGETRIAATLGQSSDHVTDLAFGSWLDKHPPLAHPLQSQALRLGVRGGNIVGIRPALPQEQTEWSATLTGPPSTMEGLIVRVRVAGAPDVQLTEDPEEEDPEEEDEVSNALTWWAPALVWSFVALCPWVVLVLARRSARPDAPREQKILMCASPLLCLAALVLGGASLLPWAVSSVATACVLLTVVPQGATLWIRHQRRVRLWDHRDTVLSWVLTALLAVLLLLYAQVEGASIPWSACAIALAGTVPATCLTLHVLAGPRALPAGPVPAVQMVVAACLYQMWLLASDPPIWAYLMLGLLLCPATFALLDVLPFPRRNLAMAAIIVCGAAGYLDVIGAVRAWPEYSLWTGTTYYGNDPANWIGFVAFDGLQVLLPLVLLMVLRGSRRLDDRCVRAVGIALGISALMYPLTTTWPALYSTLATWAAFTWLLPLARARQAGRLAAVRPRVHHRLIRLELRRRILEDSLLDLMRGAQGRLVSSELSVSDFDKQRHELDLGGVHRRGGLTIRQAAFNSAAGHSPWENGLTGLKAGLVLTMLFTCYGVWLHKWWFFDDDPTAYNVADYLRWMVYPAVAAFVYGYFYPWLRGEGPIGKALCLLLALLPAETIAMANLVLSNSELLPAAAVRVGQLLLICLLLGLYWERRLLQAAALPWSAVRTWRTVRSLTTPTVTVLVAAATAAATALAGAAITRVLQDPTSLPQESPSTSVSPTPRR